MKVNNASSFSFSLLPILTIATVTPIQISSKCNTRNRQKRKRERRKNGALFYSFIFRLINHWLNSLFSNQFICLLRSMPKSDKNKTFMMPVESYTAFSHQQRCCICQLITKDEYTDVHSHIIHQKNQEHSQKIRKIFKSSQVKSKFFQVKSIAYRKFFKSSQVKSIILKIFFKSSQVKSIVYRKFSKSSQVKSIKSVKSDLT